MDKVHVRRTPSKFSTNNSSSTCFTRIYARDSPFVRRVLLRFGIPSRDVDDLVQNVFVVMWQRLNENVLHGELRPWLYAVAANVARNYRSSSRVRKEQFVEVLPEGSGSRIDMEGMLDAWRSLARLLRRLREKLREVFVRVMLGGEKVQRTAEALGIPVKTVETRRRLVRQLLLMCSTA